MSLNINCLFQNVSHLHESRYVNLIKLIESIRLQAICMVQFTSIWLGYLESRKDDLKPD